MNDIALVWKNDRGDILQNGVDLLTDDSIMTAVIISLFTDRRALDSDVLPDGTDDRRGWWADSYRSRPTGSRLWLLSREKTLQSVVNRTQTYAREALDWMVPAGLLRQVSCEAARVGHSRLRLSVMLVLPDGSPRPVTFYADLQGV